MALLFFGDVSLLIFILKLGSVRIWDLKLETQLLQHPCKNDIRRLVRGHFGELT